MNSDDLEDNTGLNIEFDSLMYILHGLSKIKTDLDEAFEKAYAEFELDNLKNNKQECHDKFIEICSGNNLDLIRNYIQNN